MAFLNCYFLIYMYSLIASFLSGLFIFLTNCFSLIQEHRIQEAIRQSIVLVEYSEEYKDYQEALREIEHARYLLGRNLHEDALSSARIALALAPDVGDLHRLLGDIYRDLGDAEQALRHYRRYIELVPGRHRDQEIVRGIIEELGG